jgi:hypothetical protein
VSFGRYVFGASRTLEISVGASNSRDSGRVHWNCALVVRTDRESTVSRRALRAVFLPAAPLVRGTPNVRTIGDGSPRMWLTLVARRRTGRFAARTPAGVLRIVIAVVLASGASELVLNRVHLRPGEWLSADDEPRRQLDPRLGWTWVPERTGHKSIGGRIIDYSIDPAGYRVSRIDEPVDPERPTILFTGESVMFGEGLTYEESIPAHVGAMIGVQTANLAVHAYGHDQAYLRLRTELPHFRRPVAVVSLFMTTLFGRNLDQDRPHLGASLVWLPAEQRSRLSSLAKLVVRYRADTTVERGVAVTQQVLRTTSELARAHGATLLVVLQFGHEAQPEQTLRRRILDNASIPYVLVEIDSSWRLPWDRHPNARAARAIATAIASELRGRFTAGPIK